MKKLAVICGSTNIGGAEVQLIEFIDSLREICEISLYLIGKQGDFTKLLEERKIHFQGYSFSKFSWAFDFMRFASNLRGLNPNTVLGWLYKGEIIGAFGAFITRVDYFSKYKLARGFKIEIVDIKVCEKALGERFCGKFICGSKLA